MLFEAQGEIRPAELLKVPASHFWQDVGVVSPFLEEVPAGHKLAATERLRLSMYTVQSPVHPLENWSAKETLLCPEYEAAEKEVE